MMTPNPHTKTNSINSDAENNQTYDASSLEMGQKLENEHNNWKLNDDKKLNLN